MPDAAIDISSGKAIPPLDGYDRSLFEQQPEITRAGRIRRWLHQHPELSGKEEQTARLIAHLLQVWGYRVLESVGGHGVVGILDRDPAAPRLGLRADIDALPIHETSLAGHASQTANVMHACGHDGHTAILLAFAERAVTFGSRCNLVLVFQPAEETGRGARDMLADPVFRELQLDAMFGLHNKPEMNFGAIAAPDGALLASSDRFTLEIVVAPRIPAGRQ